MWVSLSQETNVNGRISYSTDSLFRCLLVVRDRIEVY